MESDDRLPLRISWSLITKEFKRDYKSVFESKSSRIHLDIGQQIIEGAKDKWEIFALVDSVLGFAVGNDRKIVGEHGRRRFNQYMTLRKSVCNACGVAWTRRAISNNGQHSLNLSEFPRNIEVINVKSPWDTTQHLIDYATNNLSKKTHAKRLILTDAWQKLGLFKDKSIHEIISIAVYCIYTQHFRCITLNSNRPPPQISTSTRQSIYVSSTSEEDSIQLNLVCNQIIDWYYTYNNTCTSRLIEESLSSHTHAHTPYSNNYSNISVEKEESKNENQNENENDQKLELDNGHSEGHDDRDVCIEITSSSQSSSSSSHHNTTIS